MSTETADPRYTDIARWPTRSAVDAMIEGQLTAIAALQAGAQALADAADAAADRLRGGGRLCYAGAGTSGRIAVQDGVELSPTFDWGDERLVFLMAGGLDALTSSAEGAEDDSEAARAEVARAGIGEGDVLVGVAASGTTPYTVAAVQAARAAGALTIGIANNAGAPLLAAADHALLAATGAEAIAGSTRMKAGTAQKAALNILSSAIMIRLGYVEQGLMVKMRVSNAKLRDRAVRMVMSLTGIDQETAAKRLADAHYDIVAAAGLGDTAR